MISDDHVADVFSTLPAECWTARFLSWAYRTSDGPQVFALAGALSALSMAASADTSVWLGTRTNACFWSLCIGDSGSRKTSKMSLAIDLLRELDPDAILKKPQSDAVLVERLAELNGRGLLFYGEMEKFFSATKKGAYREGVLAAAMELWDGKPYHTDGKSAGAMVIDKPQFALAGAAALGVLDKHTTEDTWTGGFLSRFAIFAAKKTRDLAKPPKLEAERGRLRDQLGTILARPVGPLDPNLGIEGMSADAHQIYTDWHDRCQAVVQGAKHAWLGGVYNRLDTIALKAALTLSLDFGEASRSLGNPWVLGAAEVYFGCRVANLHADSVSWVINQLASTPYERQRRSVLQSADDQPRPLRWFLSSTKPKLSRRALSQVLDSLEAEGVIFRHDLPAEPHWAILPPSPGSATTTFGLF